MRRRISDQPAEQPQDHTTLSQTAKPDSSTAESDWPTSTEALLLEKYREAIQHHLNHPMRLFRTLTGLSCRVSWAPTLPHQWAERDLPIHFPLCRCLISQEPGTVSRCRKCATHYLKLTLQSGHRGHIFTCFRGVHNYWHPVIIRHRTVGLAFIQALGTQARRACIRKRSTRAGAGAGVTRSASLVGRACRAARRMNRAEFDRSSRLLQLVFEHAESLTLADLRQADLVKTRQALRELQTVATRLREDLNGLFAAVHRTPAVLQEETHAEQIVHDLLDYVALHYGRPVTLKQCARSLNLNAAYLSSMFSKRVGLPFKAYLTEVRLEKARELLSQTRRNISDIASAVGYASENRFRIAFKKATGLAPTAWRETLRVTPGPAASSPG